MRRARVLLVAVIAAALFVAPAGAFIGAGINLDKGFEHTINFDLPPIVAQAAGVAAGGEDLNLGVTFGANYDVNALAGYPFGYGGVGSLTDANVGYNLGLSMDETHGAAFDGSAFGIPLTEGSTSTTQYDNSIAKNMHLANEQVSLPWTFPVM